MRCLDRGEQKHLNYLTFKELFKNMVGLKDPKIIETGISSAGVHSTYLFNEYVRKYGGRFWSVDINQHLVDIHQSNMCPATKLICDDSVKFISDWVASHENEKVDVVYLDSYDLDWYNPHPSAMHGLNEYLALHPALKKDSLLLIDDTPASPYWLDTRGQLYHDMVNYYNTHNFLPGKGQYVLSTPKHATTLMHHYQILYKIT
jgi:hypothetical protein